VVEVAHDVSLDFLKEGTVHPQHYAFLVDENEFDQIHERILARGIPDWADPGRSRPQQVKPTTAPAGCLAGPGQSHPRDPHGSVRRLAEAASVAPGRQLPTGSRVLASARQKRIPLAAQ
jgi:hypothetical protein